MIRIVTPTRAGVPSASPTFVKIGSIPRNGAAVSGNTRSRRSPLPVAVTGLLRASTTTASPPAKTSAMPTNSGTVTVSPRTTIPILTATTGNSAFNGSVRLAPSRAMPTKYANRATSDPRIPATANAESETAVTE